MEELTQAAKAAYEHFSEYQKRAVKEFFSAMDKDGDGKISLQEFMSFCQEQLPDQSSYNRFINLFVDQNADGTLGFDQVLTLFYLKARGWYICDGCGVFVMSGLFFTCTRCRLSKNAGKSYDLCIPCYHGQKFKHEHTEFLDNHAVLLKKRAIQQKGGATRSRSEMGKVKEAFEVFDTAFSFISNLTEI